MSELTREQLDLMERQDILDSVQAKQLFDYVRSLRQRLAEMEKQAQTYCLESAHFQAKVSALEQELADMRENTSWKTMQGFIKQRDAQRERAENAESAQVHMAKEYQQRLAKQKERAERLEKALVKCRRELWHCNHQLVQRGAREGASVTEALRETDDLLMALKAEAQQVQG